MANLNLLKKTFSSLENNNFKNFFITQSISLIGSWMQQTALMWLIYDLTNSKLLLGVVAALGSLPMLLFSAFGGALADKYSKQKLLVITQSLTMTVAVFLAAIIGLKVYKVWHFIMISALSGIVFSIDLPVRQSFYGEMVKKTHLMNAIALNSSMVNLARIIGPAVAGIIMAQYSIFWCFVINALTFFPVIFVLATMKLDISSAKKHSQGILESMTSGFGYVKNHAIILNSILVMIIVTIFGWSYGILLPVFAKEVFNQGEKCYAMLLSANGAGALIGALCVAYLGNYKHKKNIINYGVYWFGGMLILFALSKIYWLSLILIASTGFGALIYFSSNTTLIQYSVDDSMRGRVMGIWALIFGGMVPIGSLLSGILAHYIGVSKTLIIGAVICIFSTALLSILMQRKTDEKYEQPEAIDV